LHARAAAKFVNLAKTFSSDITLGGQPASAAQRVDGKSIMGVMLLAAAQGTELDLIAEGADADDALAALSALISDKFGESL